MKKYSIRIEMIAYLSVVILIAAMAAVTADAYAGTYNTDIDENVKTTLWWGDTFDADAVTYLEIKPSKKGTITFTADFFSWISLCDSNKNVISKGYDTYGDCIQPDNENDYLHQVHYGVKAGKTYYLKVVNMPRRINADGQYEGVVKYTNTKIKPAKCGSSKKKAKAIKKNKKIKGLFVAGNKKAQWYKITNKQKTTKITITASNINYALNVVGYYKSGGKWKSDKGIVAWQKDYKKNTFTGKINKKVKHTYYLKIYPEGQTSGSYTIKWK